MLNIFNSYDNRSQLINEVDPTTVHVLLNVLLIKNYRDFTDLIVIKITLVMLRALIRTGVTNGL